MSDIKKLFAEGAAPGVLGCVPEKFIVDFANGIDVAGDHLRSQQDRPLFQRLKEGLNGQYAARQQAIDASLLDGVQGSLSWLTELTSSLAKSNLALTRVNDRVNQLMQSTAELANYAADTHEQLTQLTEQVKRGFSHLEQQLYGTERQRNAQAALDLLLSRWSAGRYNALPLAARCYIVLEELRWNAFGDAIRDGSQCDSQRLLETLRNNALTQMALDSGLSAASRQSTQTWLAWHGLPNPQHYWPETVSWIADWSQADTHPVSWSVANAGAALPLRMPRICSSERLVDGMIAEIFGQEAA